MYDPDWFPNADTATRTLAIGVGAACMLLAMVPAIFIRSNSTKNDNSLAPLNFKSIGASFIQIIRSFKDAFQSEPFRKICIATFCIFNAFNTIASFSFFIVVYHLFQGDAAAAGVWPTLFGSIGALVTTFIVIPIVAAISKRIGKKKAFLLSQAISIMGYILLWFLFIPGKPYMFIFALPFFSFGIGSLFTLMMSMTADVCDLDELNSGKRREGIFGAIYWWMVKFGFAIAGLLSGAILSLVGFNPGAESQAEDAITGLRIFYSGVPILGTLVAMFVMKDYDLSEEKCNEIRAILDQRKSEKPIRYTSYPVVPNRELIQHTNEQLEIEFPFYKAPGIDFSKESRETLVQQFHHYFNKGMHGICFTAYTKDQNPGDQITREQVIKRLEVLQGHTQWIRIFSCTNGHELIPELAKKMGFKTMVGAWISNDLEQNQKEMDSLKSLIQKNLVDIAAIGNEVLFRNELDAKKLLEYISQIRKYSGDIPVSFVDVYYEVMNHPELIEASDLVLVNCYPYWEGADIRLALFNIQQMLSKVELVAQGKKIVIAETGWPSQGQIVHDAIPSKENVMRYFTEVSEWQLHSGIEVFYFASFDESWKIHFEGWTGTSWGLWDREEKFKYEN